jgi:hypothetical protein
VVSPPAWKSIVLETRLSSLYQTLWRGENYSEKKVDKTEGRTEIQIDTATLKNSLHINKYVKCKLNHITQ